MKVTKGELNSRIKNCTKGLGLFRKSNPGNDPPGTAAPTAQARDSSPRDTQTRTEKRMAAITNYEKCSVLYEDLLAEIKEVPDYNDTDDHTITKGMKRKADWAKCMRELRLDIIETKNKITACNVSDHATLIDSLEQATTTANELLSKTIKDIEAADVARGIFSDRAVKSCPKKLPAFAGLESEDFSFFKDQFTEAAKDNRVPKSDQAEKLRETLTGRALQHMPKACKDIQEAWTVLDAAFGSPRTLLNYRLKKVRSMPGLTDTLLQADPGFTATWYLDFGAANQSFRTLNHPQI